MDNPLISVPSKTILNFDWRDFSWPRGYYSTFLPDYTITDTSVFIHLETDNTLNLYTLFIALYTGGSHLLLSSRTLVLFDFFKLQINISIHFKITDN